MKAFITVLDFGDNYQKLDLCETLGTVTGLSVSIDGTGNPALTCDVEALGALMQKLAKDEKANWIEYTVQFG